MILVRPQRAVEVRPVGIEIDTVGGLHREAQPLPLVIEVLQLANKVEAICATDIGVVVYRLDDKAHLWRHV